MCGQGWTSDCRVEREAPFGATLEVCVGVRCSICGHPACPEIDAALIAGTSTPRVAREFGVHRSSVARHAKHHLASEMTEAVLRQEEAAGLAILGKAGRLYEHCEALLGDADAMLRQRPDSTAGISAATRVIRETRATLELIAKALDAATGAVPIEAPAPAPAHSDFEEVIRRAMAYREGGRVLGDGTLERVPPCPQCGDQPEPRPWLEAAARRNSPSDLSRWDGLR